MGSKRRLPVPSWLIAAVVLAVIALLLLQLPDDVFWSYSWVVFPGVFVAAAAARFIEEHRRKRRLEKFRDSRG